VEDDAHSVGSGLQLLSAVLIGDQGSARKLLSKYEVRRIAGQRSEVAGCSLSAKASARKNVMAGRIGLILPARVVRGTFPIAS
jgi:hypothetical protein